MDISPSTLVLLTTGSALLGYIVPSVFNLLSARSAQKSEERRQVKALVVQAAAESWKVSTEARSRIGKEMQAPFDVFLLHMAKSVDVFFDPTTNADNLDSRLKSVDDITEVMITRADRLTEGARKKEQTKTPILDQPSGPQQRIAD